MHSHVQDSASPEGVRPTAGFEASKAGRAIRRVVNATPRQYQDRAALSSIDKWLDVKSAAAYAGISEGFCCSLMTSGKMRSVKRGRLRRTRASWVDQWLMAGGRP